jgi:hypothetical protein
MRYEDIADIIFNDPFRGDITIKEYRPIKTFEEVVEIPFEKNTDLDELISRQELEGDFAEDLTYSIIDANKVEMIETDFDLSKFKKIKVPVSNDI